MSRYATQARGFVDDLKATLSTSERQALWDELHEWGPHDWVTWCGEHEKDVHAFLVESPAHRASRNDWQAPALRAKLVLAAIRLLQQAEVTFRALAIAPCLTSAACDYRTAAVDAGTAFLDIQAEDVPLWPLEGSSPFPVG